jgi:hypothetical protein
MTARQGASQATLLPVVAMQAPGEQSGAAHVQSSAVAQPAGRA